MAIKRWRCKRLTSETQLLFAQPVSGAHSSHSSHPAPVFTLQVGTQTGHYARHDFSPFVSLTQTRRTASSRREWRRKWRGVWSVKTSLSPASAPEQEWHHSRRRRRPTTTTTTTTKTTVTSCAGRIIHEGERRRGKGGSVSAKKSLSQRHCVRFQSCPIHELQPQSWSPPRWDFPLNSPPPGPREEVHYQSAYSTQLRLKVCKEFVTKRRSVALTRQHCATPELIQSRCSTSTWGGPAH